MKIGRTASRYASAVAATAAATALRVALSRHFGNGAAYITFYPTVMFVAMLGGLGPGLAATGLSAACAALWVLPSGPGRPIAGPAAATLAVFALMGVAISVVSGLHRRSRERVAEVEKRLALRESAEALERKEEEARARAVELEAILSCIDDGVIVYDREGRTIRSNPAADEILGLSPAERRAPVQERVSAQYEVTTEDGLRLAPEELIAFRAAVRGEVVKRVVNRVQSFGREPRWLMLSAIPLFVEGEHAGAVLSVADITDRKRAVDALHEANEKLREADRRKDEFLGMLSHELRNPLAPIRNATYLLRHAEPGSEPSRRAQAVIERQTEHLTRLVDDLLDVTRVARGKFELRRSRTDLRQVVSHAAEDYQATMRDRGVRFDVELPDVPLWADADPTRIAQLVGNLLHNAAKFTRDGGAVTLSAAARADGSEIRVRDTGAGIEPALLAHVFDPFVQGERTLARTDGGLGLGLALVKGIAELHGGSVRAESAGEGAGAEFVVCLPAPV